MGSNFSVTSIVKRLWLYAGKAITAGAILAGASVTAGLVHGNALIVTEAVLTVLGTYGVYQAPANRRLER
jgi:hypothetical protein